MKVPTKCKFCGRPIEIWVDDAYARMGDPFKLVKLAACNRCSDLKVEKRLLDSRLNWAISRLQLAGDEKAASDRYRGIVSGLMHKYWDLICRWTSIRNTEFDEGIVEMVLSNPSKCARMVSEMWRIANLSKSQQELPV